MKIGIDIGRSHIGLGVVNNDYKIVELIQKSISQVEKKSLKKTIEQFIIENCLNLSHKYHIESICLALPGIIKDNKIQKAINLDIQKQYDIISKLKEYIDVKYKIANDTNCAAIAEYKIGILKNKPNSIFLTLGTGVGLSVFIDGNLLNKSCEFGHTILKENGKMCNCTKKGCFEQYCSMKSFKNEIRKTFNFSNSFHGSDIYEFIKENKKNKKLEKIIDEYTTNLVIGISNLVNIFDSNVVGIGGSFVYFENILLDILNEKINSNNYIFSNQKVEIKSAILGNNAGIIGATLI